MPLFTNSRETPVPKFLSLASPNKQRNGMVSLAKMNMFRAFRSRNFRLFFIGQSISRIGMWMQRTAVIWLIYSYTHSSFMLGVAVFAEQFPSFVCSLWGGVIADRYPRYRIMIYTQLFSLLQAVLLAAYVLAGYQSVWVILGLSVMLGVINAFDLPARQPLIHYMVDQPEDFPNALALNSTLANLARLIGPALAGILLETLGGGSCFLINAISYIAILWALFRMNIQEGEPVRGQKNALSEAVEGFNYIRQTPTIGGILLLLVVVSFFVLSFRTLLPVFAKDIFNGDATTFGYMNSFSGLGAVIGALYITALKRSVNLKFLLWINCLILGIAIILFAWTREFYLSMFLLMAGGFAALSETTISNIMVQTLSARKMLGRVMSYWAMALMGVMPLGSLFIGALAHRIGAPLTLTFEGIIAFILVIAFFPFLVRSEKARS